MMETDTAVSTALKISCDRDEFVSRLGIVSRAVSTRGSVQVLSGVLLRVEAGGVELAATDMELSLRTTLQADVEGEGAVVVPGKLLVDLARLLPDARVALEHRADEGVLHVTSGTYSSRLNVFDAEDFPRLPPVDVPLHEVERGSLLATIDRVARSASRDESRPVLTGIRPREPRRLRHRRLVAHDTADRRAVPELQAASARDLRGGSRAPSRGGARRRPPRGGQGAAELAAAAPFRRG
jgi:DNA polymerase-3 subunit beta